MISEEQIWITYISHNETRNPDKLLNKSFKINSKFLQEIISELVIDRNEKHKMMKKYEQLLKKEEQFGKKNYCYIKQNMNSRLVNKMDITPEIFEMYLKTPDGIIKIDSTFVLENFYKEIRIKIFGIYFSGFLLKIDKDGKHKINIQNKIKCQKKRSCNKKTTEKENEYISKNLKKVKNIQNEEFSKESLYLDSKSIFEKLPKTKEIINTTQRRKRSVASSARKSILSRKKSDSSKACPICLDPISDKRGVLDCDHDYCFECIDNWMTETNICPMCKIKSKLFWKKNKK